MKSCKNFLTRIFTTLAATSFLAFATPSQAAVTIIDVNGTTSTNSPGFEAGGGAMVQFTLASQINNVAITSNIVCLSCKGIAYILTDFGSGTSLSDIVSATSFGSNTDPLLTTSSLAAGTYYLFLGSLEGGFVWNSSKQASYSVTPGSSVGSSFATINFDQSVPFASEFEALFGEDLLFKITADSNIPVPDPTSAVPEPATWIFMVLGMAAVGFSMRRMPKQTLQIRHT